MSQVRTTEVLSTAQEALTRALKTMDNDHAYIHQGKYFTAITKNTLQAAAVLKIQFKTPLVAAGYVHYRPALIVSSKDSLTVKFYEAAEGLAGGVAVTPVNRNRNSTEVSGVTLKVGVTTTGNGTQISEAYIPGATGVGGTSSGNMLSASNEWVLKPNTEYLIELTNASAAANDVLAELQWYEEEA